MSQNGFSSLLMVKFSLTRLRGLALSWVSRLCWPVLKDWRLLVFTWKESLEVGSEERLEAEGWRLARLTGSELNRVCCSWLRPSTEPRPGGGGKYGGWGWRSEVTEAESGLREPEIFPSRSWNEKINVSKKHIKRFHSLFPSHMTLNICKLLSFELEIE